MNPYEWPWFLAVTTALGWGYIGWALRGLHERRKRVTPPEEDAPAADG